MSSEQSRSAVDWRKSDPHLSNDQDVKSPIGGTPRPNGPSPRKEPSLLRAFLGSCGGFVETAALLLGPSDCLSCVNEPLQSTRSTKSMRKHPTAKKLAQKLKDSPSREGEVVDVPIKLIKSTSGNPPKNEEGEVYDPYRSFDDSISAISAHTLDEMARRYPKPLMTSLRANDPNSRPRNGDELLPPPSPVRISSDSSEEINQRDENNPHDEIDNEINFDESLMISMVEQTSFELIENDIPFVVKKGPVRRSSKARSGSRASSKRTGRSDAHSAITPKAKGRKSKRRSKWIPGEELEPQIAEI